MEVKKLTNSMYTATCLITGKKENLQMHPMYNSVGDMIGWVFVHESIELPPLDDKLSFVEWSYRIGDRVSKGRVSKNNSDNT